MQGVRFYTVLSLFLTVFSVLCLGAEPGSRESAKLRQKASELIRKGDFRQAVVLLRQGNLRDTGLLTQLLDLQVRLKDDVGAAETMIEMEGLLPVDNRLRTYSEFQLAGTLAGARFRLGQEEGAHELWSRMKEQATTNQLALAVFHAYRQVKLNHEAEAWVDHRRAQSGDASLWALELSHMHQDAGQWIESFEELARWADSGRAGSDYATRRMLGLAEASGNSAELIEFMYHKTSTGEHSGLHAAVLGVLVQARFWKEAEELAWRQPGPEGQAPFSLSRHLLEAGEPERALSQLKGLEEKKHPRSEQPDFLLLKGACCEAANHPEDALEAYRAINRQSHLKTEARFRSASLLYQPLGQLDEARDLFEELLREQPGNFKAGRAYLRLLAGGGMLERARELIDQQLSSDRMKGDQVIEARFWRLRLEWWNGRFAEVERQLGEFLKQNLAHDDFNDAIELMDVFAFRAKDSLAVARAGRADQFEFAGQSTEALRTLDDGAREEGDLQEWFAWRACRLSETVEKAGQRRERFGAFRRNWPESLHGERLDWMELHCLEELELPADSLRDFGMSMLERWPEGMLQDAVRRKVQQKGMEQP